MFARTLLCAYFFLWRLAIHDTAKLMPGLQNPEFTGKIF